VLDRNGKATLPLVYSTVQLRPTAQIKPVQDKKFELTLLGSNAKGYP
jgi:hypothetical protein